MNANEPLTPEERDLARLLGRAGDKAPPPALDAAILAAARAATEGTPAPARRDTAPVQRAVRKRPRWPAVFGVAASVVFAVGLAWQLRPEAPRLTAPDAARDDTTPQAAADVAATTDAPAAAEMASARVEAAPAAPAAADAAPPPPPAPMARHAAPAPPPPAEPAAPVQRPRMAERSVAPPSPPAPPAPPAPAASAAYAAPVPAPELAAVAPPPAAADMADSVAMDRATGSAAAVAAKQSRPLAAPGVMRRSAAGALSAEAVQSEIAADAQLARRQWLRKIRDRRDAGQRDLARASLERYLQQYPEARLPRDLRPLLDD
ncbi:hypothetical protein [Stenotrophomonas sp. 24(2023)]|uniref:hypothetical protein n=1 Tax=Stenotrophomonas sp. 24(2023) TaxID=3068324 RepID=UPI0027E1E4AE|nr:hypothetical protein [Stenotrophomonas sp. 24(2023)]WMJ68846.1 hypothetical protein Q9R17_16925 [Stenotrophomonas sp. 24(2023)]